MEYGVTNMKYGVTKYTQSYFHKRKFSREIRENFVLQKFRITHDV